MDSEELTLVKIGGSVITDKSKPLSLRFNCLNNLSSALARYEGRLVLVHGGGSYAHPIAKKYGLKIEPAKVEPKGVTLTRLGVFTLHNEVVLSLLRAGIPVYSIHPHHILYKECINVLNEALSCNLTPITYGDVIPSKEGCFVISGDMLMRLLAEYLKPRKVVFIIDVDGLYDTDPKSGRLLKEISLTWRTEHNAGVEFDVTGGILGKVREAQKIASLGSDVYFVNGLYPERVLKVLRGEETISTMVSGRVRS
ncbi:MAG: isopentenyl phosphate kinase [Nitrososphaerales archaeon]